MAETKKGGFTGNMAKLGGKGHKLSLKSDFRGDSAVNSTFKKARKQAHKKV
jgi:hypothetical protein